jgi:hypothetical protein
VRSRNPSIRPLFATIIVLALAYNDWNLYHKLQTLRLLETGAQTRARVQRQIQALNHQADGWEAKADALATVPAAAGQPAAGIANDTQKWATEVRTELVAAWIDRVYAPFFKTAALNPGDLARFRLLITEKRQAILDAIDAARAQGIADTSTLRGAIVAAVHQPNAQIQTLLGDDRYTAFRQFQASLPARSAVDDFAMALPPSAPLSPEQHEATVRIIAQDQAPASRPISVVENLLINVPAPVTTADVTAAGSVLNRVQLDGLKSVQHQADLQRDVLRLLYP